MQQANIVQFPNQTAVEPDHCTTSNSSGETITISVGTAVSCVCGSCGVWYTGYHTCIPTISWYPSYPVIQHDEVRELKCWLDGFLEGRQLTPGNLKKIRAKLDEFIDG